MKRKTSGLSYNKINSSIFHFLVPLSGRTRKYEEGEWQAEREREQEMTTAATQRAKTAEKMQFSVEDM